MAGLEAPFSGTLLNALSAVLIYTGRYGEADGVLSQRVEASSFANQVGGEGSRIMTMISPDERLGPS